MNAGDVKLKLKVLRPIKRTFYVNVEQRFPQVYPYKVFFTFCCPFIVIYFKHFVLKQPLQKSFCLNTFTIKTVPHLCVSCVSTVY